MKKWLVVAVVFVLAGVLLTTCTNGDDEDAEHQATQTETTVEPAFPALEEIWRAGIDPIGLRGDPIRHDDLVVVRDSSTVHGIDAATGRVRWSRKLRVICAVADGAHDGMLVLSRSPRGKGRDGCGELVALDLATGKVAWRQETEAGIGSADPSDRGYLAVGERVIATRELICGGVHRYRLSDGKHLGYLPPLGSDDLACDDFALAGRWIAHVSSNDNQRPETFRLVNADTGKEVFTRPAGDLHLHSIVAAEPLLIELTRRGHRLVWEVDAKTGRLVTPTSPQLQTVSRDLLSLGVHGDTVAMAVADTSYLAGISGVAGFSLDGQEQWSGFPTFGSYAGADDAGPIVLTNGLADDVEMQQDQPVTRHRWSDVDDYEVLGTVPRRTFAQGVAGDVLLARGQDEIVAYRLPSSGEKSNLELAPNATYYGVDIPEDRWADGDVRVDEAPACEVSDELLTTLGFHQLDLPDPIGCTWLERAEPANFERELEIRRYVGTPDLATEASAVDVAEKEMQALRKEWQRDYSEVGVSAKVRDLPDAGDEAILVEASGVGGRQSRTAVAVRVRNMVISARLDTSIRSHEASGMAASHLYGPAVWSVVSDLLESAGEPVSLPEVSTRRTPALRKRTSLCAALADQVGWMVPGAVGRRLAPDGGKRAAGCVWAELPGDHDSAQVSMVRMPDSTLSGRTGEQLAKAGFASVLRGMRRDAFEPEEKPVRIDGLGDEAWVQTNRTWMHRSATVQRDWHAAVVIVRRGNLTLAVQLQQEAIGEVATRERAVALARAALATQTG